MPISSTPHLCAEPPNECPEHCKARRDKDNRVRSNLVQIPSLPFFTSLLAIHSLWTSDPYWKLKQATLGECGKTGKVRRARPADKWPSRGSACWGGQKPAKQSGIWGSVSLLELSRSLGCYLIPLTSCLPGIKWVQDSCFESLLWEWATLLQSIWNTAHAQKV